MTVYFYNVTVEVGIEYGETINSREVDIRGSTFEYEIRVLHGIIETKNKLSLVEEIERLVVARMEEDVSVMDITINIITCLG